MPDDKAVFCNEALGIRNRNRPAPVFPARDERNEG